ncbi:MAG: prepilin peptidase [Candidatus Taylorbacteria bacterium]|nr:prepilin peptidase [Candidatus Taylorbacteria bacterium]
MDVYFAIVFFIFGTIIGSFLNVYIYRYNTGVTLSGRSKCFSCSKTINWYDLVPVLSFFFLRGRCRSCKSGLSFQYPTVEIATGLLFFGVFLNNFQKDFSILNSLIVALELIIFSTLVIIVVYDIKHKIIPDVLVWVFGIFSLIRLILTIGFPALIHFHHILDLFSGPIVALPFFLLWLVSSGRWIGLGDAKLALGIGWFLGFSFAISGIIIGFWIGAVVGLVLIGLAKLKQSKFLPKVLHSIGLRNFTVKSEIPFAPFLILGLIIVYFSGVDVMGLSAFGI